MRFKKGDTVRILSGIGYGQVAKIYHINDIHIYPYCIKLKSGRTQFYCDEELESADAYGNIVGYLIVLAIALFVAFWFAVYLNASGNGLG